MNPEMKRCPYCGEEIRREATKCRYCLSDLTINASQTPPPPGAQGSCGYRYNAYGPQGPANPWQANDAFADGPEGKSRGICALLALLLGAFGVHYFYLGKTTGGIVYLLIALLTCTSVSAVLGLVQGIMMFCMSNEEFRQRYVTTPSSFPF